MPSVLVGETHIPRDFARYARQYSFLEIDCEPGNVPGKARLQSCAAQAPEGFVFSLVVPAALASLEPGDDAARALKAAQAIAKLMRPRWWVVRTPPSVRPTRKAREDLSALFERLRSSETRIAWEPHGLWEDAAAVETASALGAYVVHDLAQAAPRAGDVLYARLQALGRGARVSLGLAERVAERASGFAEAFVAVEGKGAQEIQRALGLLSESDTDSDADEAIEIDEET
ncbi:MAG: hypothetical protein RL685_4372 [Pseudomonadota bacterium]|jgi:uncharacterized protein YecE (DUF72 family)